MHADDETFTPQAPITHEVPTELERADAFYDMAIAAITLIFSYSAVATYHVPVLLVALPVLFAAVYTLTGEAACDVSFIGPVASGLRSKLGQRRITEWVAAWHHYFSIAVLPVWSAHCYRFSVYLRQRIRLWLTRLNVAIRCSRSRVFSRD